MSSSRDVRGEMRRLFLDRDTADRLLTGHVDPDDAPPGYARVAVLLGAVSSLPPIDPARERITLSTMVEEIRAHLVAEPPGDRRSVARRLVRAKIVAIAVGATLVGTAGLATAGALPSPAQRVAHDVFAKVGISIPDGDADAVTDDGSSRATSPEPSRAQNEAQMGAQISALARTTTAMGVSKGAIISGVASGGHSHADNPPGQSGRSHGPSGAQGQSGQPHGQSGSTHGQSGSTHGQSGSTHGQSGEPHGQSGEPHGNGGPSSRG